MENKYFLKTSEVKFYYYICTETKQKINKDKKFCKQWKRPRSTTMQQVRNQGKMKQSSESRKVQNLGQKDEDKKQKY